MKVHKKRPDLADFKKKHFWAVFYPFARILSTKLPEYCDILFRNFEYFARIVKFILSLAAV